MDKLFLEIVEKLKKGPSVLFLGQNYLKIEKKRDPFLDEICKKYADGKCGSYKDIIKIFPPNIQEDILAWMQNKVKKIIPPDWINIVQEYPWSSLVTSAIDSIIENKFENDNRKIQPILSSEYKPLDPRNKLKLHLTYLYGCINRTEKSERPPLSPGEFVKRKQEAITLARRIPEILTPFGTLIIEGYAGDSDWFDPENLFPIIDDLNPGQCYLFSSRNELSNNYFINLLIENKKIIATTRTLGELFSEAEQAGIIDLSLKNVLERNDETIEIKEKVLVIPKGFKNQTSKSFLIIDDSLLTAHQPLSEEKKYQEFREFLATSGAKPNWEGIARGFAFNRDFEEELYAKIKVKLDDKELQKDPLLLSGQSGVGKSVAFASLAYRIRKEKLAPVIYVVSKNPVNSDIDSFCQFVEKDSTLTTVIFWDSMTIEDDYYKLVRYLASRGRKAIVVGTAYSYGDGRNKNRNTVKAPSCFTEHESTNFIKFLNKFGEKLGDYFKNEMLKCDQSFLVALYRLLPSTRSQLRSGLVKEVEFSENKILKTAELNEQSLDTSLSRALYKAGLLSSKIFENKTQTIYGDSYTEIKKLFGLVFVPGKFGLNVPLSLLMRSLNKEQFVDSVQILKNIDLIEWYEDAVGNISIGPRHSLEAKLLVQSLMGGPKSEIEFCKILMQNLSGSLDIGQSQEIDFIIELLKKIGPNGPELLYYSQYFEEIANVLAALRENKSILVPRLMLQEASFLREYVSNCHKSGIRLTNSLEILTKAENVINDCFEQIGTEKINKQIFLVEKAAILASILRNTIDIERDSHKACHIYQEISKIVWAAHSLEESFFSLDTLSWVGPYLIRNGQIDDDKKFEIKADLIHLFELAESDDKSSEYLERINRRKLEFAQAIHDAPLTDKAFDQLKKSGSRAGYYIYAHQISGNLPQDRELTSEEWQRCDKAYDFLKNDFEFIRHDARVLYLFVKLWWMKKTGKSFFAGERQSLNFDKESWNFAYSILRELASKEEFHHSFSIHYLLALSLFHIDKHRESISEFKQLEKESEFVGGPRRIIKSHLASLPNGLPRTFKGEINYINFDGTRGDIYIPELRLNLYFTPRSFGGKDLRKGDILPEIHLAFNFRGPVVEPVRMAK